jgi:hypothetical protein
MPALIQPVFIAPSGAHVRLVLESFDSGEECSLGHWLEVCQLVEDADLPLQLDEAGMNRKVCPENTGSSKMLNRQSVVLPTKEGSAFAFS